MQKIKKLLSVLLCVAMLLSNVPMAFAAGETYAKITSETEFTTGSYVMVVSSGFAMGAYDNGSSPWVTAVQPKISGDTVVDAAGAVWTLTVDGSKVKITDANGVSLKPKASNTNGILSGDFSWSWSVADGIFTFKADAETVTLASNATAGQDYTNKFRAYKNTTVASNTKTYLTGFSLYKLEEGGAVVPPATEPVVTEPVVTEPVVTEPVDPNGTELTIEKAIAMGAAMEHNTYTTTKYQVTGVITEVYNTQYGNMKIADEAGNILTVYGTWSADGNTRYDALEVKPVAGDTVTVLGILGQYNGTAQIKNGWIVAHTASTEPQPTEPEVEEPAADTALTVEQAIALGASKAHNVYTTGKYYVTGVITEVYNTQYGNMKIADEAGNILTVYGTYDADGTNRYDAMTVQPVAGDTVTVYGIVGQYNGTPQIKNGWIVEHKAAGSEPEVTEPTTEPTVEPTVEPTTEPTEPEATEPSAPATGAYEKVTSAAEFTSGTYVMMVDTGYAMGAYDNGSSPWVTAVQPKVSGNSVVDAASGVWTLTVDGSTVKITDANGVTLKPKGANTNGIASGDFSWSWSVADGIFTFKADAETVTLASNATAGQDYTNKFRAYKNTTVASNTKTYLTGFSLYKLADGTDPVPPTTEPQPTEPTVEPTEPSVEPTTPAAPTELTVAEAIAMGAAMEHNTYTDVKYNVTGVITEVYNTQYGNMRIADEAGNILTVYGTYSADGATRYDALEVKPVAGDTVTVYGIVGQYNGTAQIKNGWIVAHTASTEPQPTEPEVEEPAADTALTVEQAIALGASKDHNVYTAGKYYVTGVITEVYNTQYGNMKIADEAGNILTVYGTYDADGTNRYDAMTVQPVAGDTVTVYGIVGQYNGTPQIKNGWIVEHKAAGSEPTEPEATEPSVEPTTPSEPVVEPTTPSEPEPTAPVIPEGSTVINVTVDKAEIYRGDEVTVTVSIAGENKFSSLGYIPFFSSEYFTVVSGESKVTGAFLAGFDTIDGLAAAWASAVDYTGDILVLNIKIADNAPFGTFKLTDVASVNNGMNAVPVFVLETGAKVLCRHEVTFSGLNQEKHSGVCTICKETVTADHEWDAGVITTEPSCKVPGVKTYTCTVCQHTKTESVPVTEDHVYGNWTSVDQQTHKHICSVCEKEETAAHNYVQGVCSDCGEKKNYTVTFQYEDGTVISQATYHYGDAVVVPAEVAVPETLGSDYEFNGWDQEIVAVAGDATYTAQFKLKYIRGDVNGDRTVNDSDAMYLLRYTLFGDTRYPINQPGDMNGDGTVNDADAMYLLRFTLFGEGRYPLAKG